MIAKKIAVAVCIELRRLCKSVLLGAIGGLALVWVWMKPPLYDYLMPFAPVPVILLLFVVVQQSMAVLREERGQ